MSEKVAARIKQLILDERLKPGDRLPTELEMADRFGVSRVSVREATKVLSFLGIIRAAPRRGLTIGEVDLARVTEYLGFHVALTHYPRQELLQSRRVIEGGALEYVAVAMKRDEGLCGRLEQLIARGHDAKSSSERVECDMAFHRALLAASGAGPMLVFDQLLQLFFTRFACETSDALWQQVLQEHTRLIHLLRDDSVENARSLLSRHLDSYSRQPAGEGAADPSHAVE